MSLTLIVAGIVQAAFGADLVQMILAYAPGGLTEMSLVAVALHAEVAFVATHHVIRVALVTILAGFVFRLAGVDRLARRTAG
jgi:uncharacterized membrane protein AbrB (regulator of aidB expression)